MILPKWEFWDGREWVGFDGTRTGDLDPKPRGVQVPGLPGWWYNAPPKAVEPVPGKIVLAEAMYRTDKAMIDPSTAVVIPKGSLVEITPEGKVRAVPTGYAALDAKVQELVNADLNKRMVEAVRKLKRDLAKAVAPPKPPEPRRCESRGWNKNRPNDVCGEPAVGTWKSQYTRAEGTLLCQVCVEAFGPTQVGFAGWSWATFPSSGKSQPLATEPRRCRWAAGETVEFKPYADLESRADPERGIEILAAGHREEVERWRATVQSRIVRVSREWPRCEEGGTIRVCARKVYSLLAYEAVLVCDRCGQA